MAIQGYGSLDLVTKRNLVVVRQQPDLEEDTDLESFSVLDSFALQMGSTYVIEWRILSFAGLPLQTSRYVYRGVAYWSLKAMV